MLLFLALLHKYMKNQMVQWYNGTMLILLKSIVM